MAKTLGEDMIYRLEEPNGTVHWVSDRDAHDAHHNTYQVLKAKGHQASFGEMFKTVDLIRDIHLVQKFVFREHVISLLINEWEAIYRNCGYVYIMTESV